MPFRGGDIATEKRRAWGKRRRDERGCLCALGEPCKQHGGGRGGDLQGEIGVY